MVSKKKILVIPFSCAKISEPDSQKLSQDIFMTYPGRVDPNRKEYEAFLKSLSYTKTKNFVYWERKKLY